MPGRYYPYEERKYNENLSPKVPHALARAVVDTRLPEALQHPGFPPAAQGDLVSPMLFYQGREIDRLGVKANARRYS